NGLGLLRKLRRARPRNRTVRRRLRVRLPPFRQGEEKISESDDLTPSFVGGRGRATPCTCIRGPTVHIRGKAHWGIGEKVRKRPLPLRCKKQPSGADGSCCIFLVF